MNHSHSVNCNATTIYIPQHKGMLPFIFSTRKIQPGDELTLNYDNEASEEMWKKGQVTPSFCCNSACLGWIQKRPPGAELSKDILATTSRYAYISSFVDG